VGYAYPRATAARRLKSQVKQISFFMGAFLLRIRVLNLVCGESRKTASVFFQKVV
jgi:hypothetical protein